MLTHGGSVGELWAEENPPTGSLGGDFLLECAGLRLQWGWGGSFATYPGLAWEALADAQFQTIGDVIGGGGDDAGAARAYYNPGYSLYGGRDALQWGDFHKLERV